MMTVYSRLAALAAVAIATSFAIASTASRADITTVNGSVRTNGSIDYVYAGPGFGSPKTVGENAAADIVARDRQASAGAGMEFHTTNGASALTVPPVHQGPGTGSVKSAQTDHVPVQ